MSKIVSIDRGRQELNGMVAEFNETDNPSVLINAIEFALKHSIFESDELYAASLRLQDIQPATNLFEEFSRVLPIFSIKYETERPDLIRERIEELDAQYWEAHKDEPVVAPHRVSDEKYDELLQIRERCKEKYAYFEPAMVIVELLEEAYPEELDPGKVIGDYCKLLFPDRIPKEVEEFEQFFSYEPQIKLPFNSTVHNIVKEIGRLVIDKSENNDERKNCWQSGLNNLLDPENRITTHNNIPFATLLLSMLAAPNDLFYSWMYGWWLFYNYEFSDLSPWLTEIELKTILYCCPIGKYNEPLINLVEKTEDDVEVLFFSYFVFPSKIITYKTFLDILDKGFFGSNINLETKTYKLIERILMQYIRDRSLYYGSVSILSDGNSHDLVLYLKGDIDDEALDLTMLLADTALLYDDIWFFPKTQDVSNEIIVKETDAIQERYFNLYKKAVKEGFHELGNAFISIYIFARAVHCKGRFGNINKLIPIIDEAIHRPGFQILKHTLKVVVEVIDDYFGDDPIAQLAGRVFRNYLPSEAKLHLLQPKETRRAAEEINAASDSERFLLNELGNERWEKLSDESRDYLRSTEILWKQNYMAFGCGRLDWSQLVIGYCKAIEKELLDRLDEFYQSMEFDNYMKSYNRVKPREATAGWVLKELSISDKFPDDLKNKLAMAKITVYEDKNLLKTLITIFAKYRNLAAHKDPLDMIKYTEFKKMYFQDRVIHRFIDTLS